jgi:hypothetical protein
MPNSALSRANPHSSASIVAPATNSSSPGGGVSLAPNIESIVAVNVGRGKGTWFIVKQQRDNEDDEDDEPVQETSGGVGGQA